MKLILLSEDLTDLNSSKHKCSGKSCNGLMVNNRAVSSMIRLTVCTETLVSFAIYVSDTVSLIFDLISFFNRLEI